MHGWGCAWQRGMPDMAMCIGGIYGGGGHCGRGSAWQGACMGRGILGRGHDPYVVMLY